MVIRSTPICSIATRGRRFFSQRPHLSSRDSVYATDARLNPRARYPSIYKSSSRSHLLKAFAAAVIMFYAQFGHSYQHDDEMRSLVRNISILTADQSMYPAACYIPNAEGGMKAREWEMLDYPFPPA